MGRILDLDLGMISAQVITFILTFGNMTQLQMTGQGYQTFQEKGEQVLLDLE
jgi:hypothetical protein